MTSRLLGSAITAAGVAALAAQLGAQSAPAVRTHDTAGRSSVLAATDGRRPPRHAGLLDQRHLHAARAARPSSGPRSSSRPRKRRRTPSGATISCGRSLDDDIHYDDAIWQSEQGLKGVSTPAHLAHRRSARRQDPAGERRRAEARRRARRGAQVAGPRRQRAEARRSASAASCGRTKGRRCCRPATTRTCRSCKARAQFVVMQEIMHDARVIAARRPARTSAARIRSIAATRAAGGRATRWWSRPPTSPTRRRSAARPSSDEGDRALHAASTPTRSATSSRSRIPTTWDPPWRREIPLMRTERADLRIRLPRRQLRACRTSCAPSASPTPPHGNRGRHARASSVSSRSCWRLRS